MSSHDINFNTKKSFNKSPNSIIGLQIKKEFFGLRRHSTGTPTALFFLAAGCVLSYEWLLLGIPYIRV